MKTLLQDIKSCRLCKDLPLGPRPIVAASAKSKIAIIGQAPGSVVHKTGLAWDDKSGENLRNWLGVTENQFYDPDNFALIPMGFCYPGKGKSGDLPPKPECAPTWHPLLWQQLQQLELMILIGAYAQKQYLAPNPYRTLTTTVAHFREFLPRHFVLPHPSPRNNIWQAKNPWFRSEVLPALKIQVSKQLVQ
jgi:uracil-DNA glycosylase